MSLNKSHENFPDWTNYFSKEEIAIFRSMTPGQKLALADQFYRDGRSLKKAAVINCFNLAETPESKRFAFKLAIIGLSANAKYEIKGADSYRQDGDRMEIQAAVAGRGAVVLEMKAR